MISLQAFLINKHFIRVHVLWCDSFCETYLPPQPFTSRVRVIHFNFSMTRLNVRVLQRLSHCARNLFLPTSKQKSQNQHPSINISTKHKEIPQSKNPTIENPKFFHPHHHNNPPLLKQSEVTKKASLLNFKTFTFKPPSPPQLGIWIYRQP